MALPAQHEVIAMIWKPLNLPHEAILIHKVDQIRRDPFCDAIGVTWAIHVNNLLDSKIVAHIRYTGTETGWTGNVLRPNIDSSITPPTVYEVID